MMRNAKLTTSSVIQREAVPGVVIHFRVSVVVVAVVAVVALDDLTI
jgi:hypothetical protein